ncbi:transferase 2, rSAM/selenodomain-associated [Celeribacter indicus]|uniref:Family 2 glycosyltransferase n=1 Tax=Celeribacter indicus TaxID=1208324 RepID=A0A0B5DR37_9RHOB|nr:TIGR04283 family arsenosugar biosynthesis glycosyltransferase [Celeribacter indicus]AJE45983.1 family 2 glycosyltransferase [Celeribacter indicus]SDW65447.1 transferase 2, rSAM/selenodomain-associated [Celeribacter indicus]
MRAPISVVIPTLDVTPKLRATLLTLMEGLDAGLVRELILSDGGSGDGVAEMADFVGAELVTGPAGRGGQLRRGAEAAQGDWLLFLHGDSWLPEGWAEEAIRHLAHRHDRALVFSLGFREAEGVWPRLTAGWANLRTRLFDLPYGDQALLISRELYEEAGGYRDLPLMEDVDLARRLAGRIVLSALCVRTDPARYRQRGWLRQGARNLLRLLRFRPGADPQSPSRACRRP